LNSPKPRCLHQLIDLRSINPPIARIRKVVKVITPIDLARMRAQVEARTEPLAILVGDDALELSEADGVGDSDEGRIGDAGVLGAVVVV